MKKLILNFLLVLLISIVSINIFAADFSTQIRRVSELYDNMEYEKCLKQISELEGYKFSMKKEELIEIFKYKAFIYILSDRKALAESVIKDIYELDPSFTLSPSISPKLREPFARIKKGLKKEEKAESNARVIEAKPVDNLKTGSNLTTLQKAEVKREENFFKKNIIPLSLTGGGLLLFVPGLVVRLNAASDASDYRSKLEKAPRDELGNIIGITKEEAKSKQNDIDSKVMIGNTLIILGSSAIVGGAASYFILPALKKKDSGKVSLYYDGREFLLSGSLEF